MNAKQITTQYATLTKQFPADVKRVKASMRKVEAAMKAHNRMQAALDKKYSALDSALLDCIESTASGQRASDPKGKKQLRQQFERMSERADYMTSEIEQYYFDEY